MAELDKCVGRPIDWDGGIVRFCEAPVAIGRRFCFRCHLAAIGSRLNRVATLRVQLSIAEAELDELMQDCKTP